MQSDALTLYKLIILFLLDKVDFPLTNAQISNFILDKEYTNYFSLQQCISELTEEEFIMVETVGHTSLYQITPSGEETLSFFQGMISQTIQAEILAYLKKNKYSLRDETSTLSEYHKLSKDEYMVSLRVMEKKNPIIDIHLSVPTEEDAAKVCSNWRNQSQEIYSYVLNQLLKG
jgi:DNA-binding PadR family transcriptional regulator